MLENFNHLTTEQKLRLHCLNLVTKDRQIDDVRDVAADATYLSNFVELGYYEPEAEAAVDKAVDPPMATVGQGEVLQFPQSSVTLTPGAEGLPTAVQADPVARPQETEAKQATVSDELDQQRERKTRTPKPKKAKRAKSVRKSKGNGHADGSGETGEAPEQSPAETTERVHQADAPLPESQPHTDAPMAA